MKYSLSPLQSQKIIRNLTQASPSTRTLISLWAFAGHCSPTTLTFGPLIFALLLAPIIPQSKIITLQTASILSFFIQAIINPSLLLPNLLILQTSPTVTSSLWCTEEPIALMCFLAPIILEWQVCSSGFPIHCASRGQPLLFIHCCSTMGQNVQVKLQANVS